MAKQLFYKQESKANWYTTVNDGVKPTNEQLTLGAILRIADATEAMAQNHSRLISDKEYYEKQYRRKLQEVESLHRSNSSLRGHITKLKKKLNNQLPKIA